MSIVPAWVTERDAEAAAATEEAARILGGKTIASATVVPHDEGCDGVNVLLLTFTDGTGARIVGGYGGYTGNSCDEYTEYVTVNAS